MTYLLTLRSETPGLKRFTESFDKNGWNDFPEFGLEYFQAFGYRKIEVNFDKFPGHIKKWESVPKDLESEEYVVFSDTDDVVFQTQLPVFTHDLHLAPENVTHRETIWAEHIKEFPVFTPLMDKEVYNCGTWAMKVKTMYEYINFMMTFEDGGYRRHNLEQLYFNLFIEKRKELSRVIDLSIFCPLYRNLNDGWVEKVDGVWKTNNKTISVVHANGCHKELL